MVLRLHQHNIGYTADGFYNLYCVGADVKPCSMMGAWFEMFVIK